MVKKSENVHKQNTVQKLTLMSEKHKAKNREQKMKQKMSNRKICNCYLD